MGGKVWTNDGSGAFTDSGQTLGTSSATSFDNVLGDVDGDGDLDVVFARSGAANQVYLNDGSGTFTDSGQTLGGTAQTFSVSLGDLDGDGDLDLFEANRAGEANRVYLNDGAGNFTDTGQTLRHAWTAGALNSAISTATAISTPT